MKNIIVGNAFSINMLDGFTSIDFVPIDESLIKMHLKDSSITSVVGHADTARVFTNILGVDVPMNRIPWKWDDDSELLVGQLTGPRLPEGATTLPEGASIKWWLVTKRK